MMNEPLFVTAECRFPVPEITDKQKVQPLLKLTARVCVYLMTYIHTRTHIVYKTKNVHWNIVFTHPVYIVIPIYV